MGRFLLVNQRLSDMMGYSAEQFYKKTFYELVLPSEVAEETATAAAMPSTASAMRVGVGPPHQVYRALTLCWRLMSCTTHRRCLPSWQPSPQHWHLAMCPQVHVDAGPS
jgi:hypothetical protein